MAEWAYTYDNDARVHTQTLENSQGAIDVGDAFNVPGTDTYGYDPAGRLTRYSDQNGTRTVTWDHDGNRTNYGLTADNYTAPAGQSKTVPMTYNADDTIATGPVAATGATAGYGYDNNGPLKTDGCNTYNYDGFDQTSSIQLDTNTTCGTASSAVLLPSSPPEPCGTSQSRPTTTSTSPPQPPESLYTTRSVQLAQRGVATLRQRGFLT